MKKIYYLILREIIPIFFLLNILFIMLMVIQQMIQLADLIFVHSIPTIIIIKIFIYYMPSFLGITVPMSAMLSTLLAINKLAADSELVAIYSCGIGQKELLKPLIVFAITVTTFCYINSIILIPKGSLYAVKAINDLLQNLTVNNIREKEIYNDIANIIFYADKKIDNSNFRDVAFIYNDKNMTITSKYATIIPNSNKSLILEFNKGRVIIDRVKEKEYSIINFGNLNINLPLNISIKDIPKNEQILSIKELKKNFDKPIFMYEYYKRFSMPLSPLILILLGFYVGILTNRYGKTQGLIFSMLLNIIYNILYIASINMVTVLPTLILAWIPNIILILVLLIPIKIANRN